MDVHLGPRFPDLRYPAFERHYTEFCGVGRNGHLWVDGCDVVDLAARFGTPLYVVSENQLRHNYRRFRDAFRAHHPQTEILFANKCNNSLAIRHVMNQEGAGGDCFGVQELYLSLLSGCDPRKLVLNGSNKSAAEVEMAVANGVMINLDALDELDLVNATAERMGRDVDVGIRVKLTLDALQTRFGAQLHGSGSLADQARAHKWGMTPEETVAMVRRIGAEMPRLRFRELSYHLGRLSNDVRDFAEVAREMVRWAAMLHGATGVVTEYLDLGGGWAFGRPERTGPYGQDDENTPSFEQYAAAVCPAIADECRLTGLPLPKLKIEPGRALAACSTITVGRVGAVKRHPTKTWVNVDCSQNHILRIFTSHWHHHIVAANRAAEPCTEKVDVVGSLCSLDDLGLDRMLPPLARGDLVALLDTGSYAEATAANFNAELRPATVMVAGDSAEITTERERMSDVIGRFRVPARLLAGSFGRGA